MACLHHPWPCAWPTLVLGLVLVLAALLQPGQSAEDHYRTLGISKTADAAAIKGAYRRLALKLHPDKLSSLGKPKESQRQQFLRIQAAYEVLSDPEKRRQYDHHGSASQDGHWGQQQQQQQQQHFHHHWQQRQATWDDPERVLPSNTIKLTPWNFRQQVLNNAKPFLILVYSHTHAGCRKSAPKWEAAHIHLTRDDWAQLGRVNWHYEQRLVHAMSQGTSVFGYTISFEELPLVLGVPPGCTDFSCFKRYQSGLDSTSALIDFVADELLQLPALPLLTSDTLPTFIQRTPSHMVIGIAFSSSRGSSGSSSGGSLRLRRLAWRQRRLVRWGRVQLAAERDDALMWRERFGVQRAPALVLLRGPGTEPKVLHLPAGSKTDLEALTAQQGLAWQALPPLRSTTAPAIGCGLGAAAIRSAFDAGHWRGQQQQQGRQGAPAELCVVVMGRAGRSLDAARANLLELSDAMKAGSGLRGLGTVWRPLGKALASGSLQLAWMDAGWQPEVCHWHMRHMTGDAADIAGQVCGSRAGGWRALVPRAAEAAAEAAGQLAAQALNKLLGRAESVVPQSPVVLLAYQPFGQGLQWRRHAYYFALHPDVGLMGSALAGEDKEGLAGWLARCLQEAHKRDLRLPPQATEAGLPPQLQAEPEDWWEGVPPLEAAEQWLRSQGAQLWAWARSTVLLGVSDSVRPLLPVMLAGAVLAVMMIMMRGGGGGSGSQEQSVERAQEAVILDDDDFNRRGWEEWQEEDQQESEEAASEGTANIESEASLDASSHGTGEHLGSADRASEEDSGGSHSPGWRNTAHTYGCIRAGTHSRGGNANGGADSWHGPSGVAYGDERHALAGQSQGQDYTDVSTLRRRRPA